MTEPPHFCRDFTHADEASPKSPSRAVSIKTSFSCNFCMGAPLGGLFEDAPSAWVRSPPKIRGEERGVSHTFEYDWHSKWVKMRKNGSQRDSSTREFREQEVRNRAMVLCQKNS